MQFMEIIAVYSESHARPKNTKHSLKIDKIAGTYNYHKALKR
jgi:hypothetical protein